MRRRPVLLFALLLALAGAGRAGEACAQPADTPADTAADTAAVLDGAFWKRQGLERILPAWTANAADTAQGAFFSTISRDWTPDRSARKYPGMIGRHVFSYAAAYLMSGEDAHLERASEAMDFMISRGWDEQYGGWYNAVSRTGAVTDSSKDLFMQIYAATGLALYYAATHSQRARRYLERTRRLLRRHAWDRQRGGYVRSLRRDLSVKEPVKDFSPQLAPVSGYLLYLYRATGEETYLRQAERLVKLALKKMRAPATGWIRERFAHDWQFLPDARKNRYVNVGHNIEVAWMLLRLHLLTGKPRYERAALELSRQLTEQAFREDTGAWLHRLTPGTPSDHPDVTPWWVQAYGNLFQLYLYRATGDEAALRRFRKGARFWNEHFVDTERGGTVLMAALDGRVTRGDKAVRSKTSYHAMEHALLGYLLTTLWVEGQEATLHFRIDDPAPSEQLHPLLVEGDAVRLQRVVVNGEEQPARGASVPLPERGPARVRVTLGAGGSPRSSSADSLFDLVLYGRNLRAGQHRVFLKSNPGFGEAWEPVGTVPPETADAETVRPHAGADTSSWGAVVLPGLSRERYVGQDFRENYLALKIATPTEGTPPSHLGAVYAVPHHRRNTTARLSDALRTRPADVRTRSLASYVRPRPTPLRSATPFIAPIEASVRYARPGEAEVAWLEVLFGGD